MPTLVTNIRWSDNTRETAQNIQAGLSTIGRSVGEVRQQVREAAKTVSDLEKALDTIKPSGKALVDLSAELDRAKGAHASLKQELAALDPKAKSAADALKKVGQEGSAAGKGLKDAGDGAKDAGDQAEKARAKFQQVGAALSTVGRGLTAAVTVPIVGAAVASVKFASDFEADMVKVHTLSGVTETDMQQMRLRIIELGPAVGIGPDALAKAMLAVTSTGITGAKAMDILTIAAKASAVGMGDAATIARTITSIIKAYGEENITAGHAAEVMFKIVKDGNAEASELAGSLGRVVGIASTLGIAFEDVGAFIATFTRIGVNTAEAVTALRGLVGNLELKKPSKDAIAALASVGLTFDTLRAKIKDVGLTAAALDLFGRFKGHEADLQPVIANIRAMAGSMGTYGAQAKDVEQVHKHMIAQTTELQDGFVRMTQTGEFKWKALQATLQALAITIGDELLPHIKNLIDNTLIPGVKHVEDWVRWWKALPEPMKEFSLLILGMGAAGGPVLLGLGAIARSIGAIQLLLFGTNVVGATSVAAFLAKLGMGGAAAGGAAAGAAGGTAVGVAEGAGLAALTQRLQGPAGGLGAGGALTGAQSVAMGGALWLAARQANEAFDRVDKELLDKRQKAFEAALPKATTSDALFPGGKPTYRDFGQTGIVAGTRIEDVIAEGAAHATLAEKVKALTAAEREDILAKHALKESIKAIAAETGIAADVVAMFLRQQASGAGETKKYAAAWAELNSMGEDYAATLAALSPAQIETIANYLKAGASVETLAAAYPNLTKAQIKAVDASAKASAFMRDEILKLTREFGKIQDGINKPVEADLHARTDAIGKMLVAASVAEATYARKVSDLSKSTTDLQIRDLKRAEEAEIRSLGVRAVGFEQTYDDAAEQIRKFYAEQVRLANGTSDNIVAITHALGLQTAQELQASVAKFKHEYETLKNSGVATWEAIDAARKKYEDALAASNAGEAFKQGLKHALQGIPDLFIQAFLGGGGLKGALSALGVELGKVFAEALTRSIKESMAGVQLPPGAEGPVQPGGVSGTTIFAGIGIGALTGIGAEAAGASGKRAAASVALTAGSTAITAGMLTTGALAGKLAAAATVGAWTAGIGLGVVAAIEIYKAKHMAPWEKLGKDIGRDLGVNLSKETLKAWEQEGKVFGRQATGLLHLDEIIAAAGGIAKFGFDKAAAGAHDLFSMLQTGKLSIDQVKSELDKLWPSLLKGGTDAYGRINEKLKELIRLNQQYGTESQAIADFLKGQAGNLAGGFNATVDVLGTTDVLDQKTTFESIGKEVTDAKAAVDALVKAGKTGTSEWREAVEKLTAAQDHQLAAGARNKQTLDDLGSQALVAYAAAIATGATQAEALAAIAPSLKTLRESYKALGLDVEDVGVKALLMQDAVLNGPEKLGAGVAGLNAQMVALDNLNLMTEERFASLERTGAKLFDRLKAKAIESGASTDEVNTIALAPMQQFLHEAEDAAKKYGYRLDDATQAMIDLSKAEGVWKESDPSDTLEGGVKDLVQAVKELINTLRGIPNELPDPYRNWKPPPGWSPQPIPDRRQQDGGGDGVATGGIVRPWGIQHFTGDNVLPFIPRGRDVVPAMLAVDEMVINGPQQRRMLAQVHAGAKMAGDLVATGTSGSTGSRPSISLTAHVYPPPGTSIADMEAFAPAFKEGLRLNTGLMRTTVEGLVTKKLQDEDLI